MHVVMNVCQYVLRIYLCIIQYTFVASLYTVFVVQFGNKALISNLKFCFFFCSERESFMAVRPG